MDLSTLCTVGRGGFSKVHLVKDVATEKLYALKIILPHYVKFVHREIKILNILKNIKHKNIVQYFGTQTYKTNSCLLFEPLFCNLYTFYKQHTEKINNQVLCKFTKQMLEGVEFIHSIFIIHADLKPENIMITSLEYMTIKIIDFGASIIHGSNLKTNFYIVSRFYRAPELLYEEEFSGKIDIWSLGCIIYELIVFKPLFYSKTIPMLKVLMSTLSYEFGFVKYIRATTLFTSFTNTQQLYLIGLLHKMLEYDHLKRFSATQCLKSPYFNLIN